MKRRAPNIHVLLYPVKVQGEGAAEEIAEAISDMNDYGDIDLLIVGRGGGSIEDLWAFNEEAVARSIAASSIPVISAVGHETDFTISDLVADQRAPTPSAAAELVTKSRLEVEAHLDHLMIRLRSRVDQAFELVSERLSGLERRLDLYRREFAQLPDVVTQLEERLVRAVDLAMHRYAERLGVAAAGLEALSPLRQLSRGFVIASKDKDGIGLTRSAELSRGEVLWLRFAQGRAKTRVEEVED